MFYVLPKNHGAYLLFKKNVFLKIWISISQDVFEVNTSSVKTAHKIISQNLTAMTDLLPAYEEYLRTDMI